MSKKKSYKKGEFKSSKLSSLILSLFKRSPTKKQNYKQVCKALGFKDMGLKIQVVDVLNRLVRSGALKEERRGSFCLSFNEKPFLAKVKNTNKRGVYLELEGKEELFVDRKNSMFALAGDLVEVIVFNSKKKKQEGKITNVINRKKTSFVGRIDSSSANVFLIPDDGRVYFDVFITSKSPVKQYTNKKVLVLIDSWSVKQKNPVGFIKKVIGTANEHNTEIESILFNSGFDSAFSKTTTSESLKISCLIPKKIWPADLT